MENTTNNFLDKTNKAEYQYEKELQRKNIEGQGASDEDCHCDETDDENDCECLIEKENIPEKEKTTQDILKKVGWFIGETALISGIGMVGMSLLPSALGFTAGGVAARSLAAAYQSRFLGGTIVRGSLFSIMQRAGVKGFATSAKVLVGTGLNMVYQAASASIKKNENQNLSSNTRNNKKCRCKKNKSL